MLVAPCVSSILPAGAIEVSELKRVIMTWGEDFRWWQRRKFKITKSKDEELPPSHMPLRFQLDRVQAMQEKEILDSWIGLNIRRL